MKHLMVCLGAAAILHVACGGSRPLRRRRMIQLRRPRLESFPKTKGGRSLSRQ
jgi:hypothetical protein